jgi:LacI family transcriptional regulator
MTAVAKAARVSSATASRVLGGQAEQARIPAETARAVLEAARRLGYSPTRRFFKPKSLRTGAIGLVLPDCSHYFLAQLARGIVQCASQSGLSVLICDSLEDSQVEQQRVEEMAARDVDGLLLLPVGRDWQHVHRLLQQRLPVVLLDRIHPDSGCPSVGVDNYRAAFEATQYLIERGHKRIACIQRLPQAWINEERVRGYREAHEKHGLKVNEAFILGDQFGQRNGYLEVTRLLDQQPRPTALFTLSHLVTLEALRALEDRRVSVPEQMSVVGFDDLPNADFCRVPITTVRQPIERMAVMAVELLLGQISQPGAAKPVWLQLPCELARRESVRRLPPA